jgi:hypothetical protein
MSEGLSLSACLLESRKIVADEQRLAGLGKIVHLVGRIAVSLHGAFEMGHERRTFDRQIVVVFHL